MMIRANDVTVCGLYIRGRGDFCKACGKTQHVHPRRPCSQCGLSFRPRRMTNVHGFSSCEEHRR